MYLISKDHLPLEGSLHKGRAIPIEMARLLKMAFMWSTNVINPSCPRSPIITSTTGNIDDTIVRKLTTKK
ncbi:unnamed protein product [Rotaria socialis]